MKNIIVILAIFFAVSISAQTKTTVSRNEVTTVKLTPEMAAKKNVADLAAFTTIDLKTEASLNNLFLSKNQMLNQKVEISEMRKSTLSRSISSQLETILGKQTFEKVRANSKLYDSLIK